NSRNSPRRLDVVLPQCADEHGRLLSIYAERYSKTSVLDAGLQKASAPPPEESEEAVDRGAKPARRATYERWGRSLYLTFFGSSRWCTNARTPDLGHGFRR